MKKYKTQTWELEVVEVDVIRETPQMVVFIGRNGKEEKEMKSSGYCSYHDTYLDAVNYHIKRINDKINGYKKNIEDQERDLKKAVLMLDAEPTRTTTG